jgi:hypothetical protein
MTYLVPYYCHSRLSAQPQAGPPGRRVLLAERFRADSGLCRDKSRNDKMTIRIGHCFFIFNAEKRLLQLFDKLAGLLKYFPNNAGVLKKPPVITGHMQLIIKRIKFVQQFAVMH